MTRPTKVYIAGRIESSRVRYGVVECALPSWEDEDEYSPISREVEVPNPAGPSTEDVGSFIYTGPWTVSCDHGCAHLTDGAEVLESEWPGDQGSVGFGTGNHGAGFGGCIDSGPMTSREARTAIHARSFDGIRKADVVLAWIADEQAFGTLVEIGYAHGLGKKIVIGHPPGVKRTGELWFAFKTASAVLTAATAKDFVIHALNREDEDGDILIQNSLSREEAEREFAELSKGAP